MAKKKAVVSPRAKSSVSTKKSRKKSKNKATQSIVISPSIIQSQLEPPQAVIAITPATKPQMAEIISAPFPDVELVKNRHYCDDETLGKYIEAHFEGMLTTFAHLLPLIVEMKRRFKQLPRGKKVDGTYQKIRGCRSFKDWVETKLHKSERAAYYLLRGGNPQNEKAKVERKMAKQLHEGRLHKDDSMVTSASGSSQLKEFTKKAKEPFDPDINAIGEREVPSSAGARLTKAIEEITNAKSMIEALHEEMEITVNEPAEASTDTSNHQECIRGFERIIEYLDSAAGEADNVFIALTAVE